MPSPHSFQTSALGTVRRGGAGHADRKRDADHCDRACEQRGPDPDDAEHSLRLREGAIQTTPGAWCTPTMVSRPSPQSFAALADPNRRPWRGSQPTTRSAANCSIVSTPSAIAHRPSECASSTIALQMASLSRLAPKSAMNAGRP